MAIFFSAYASLFRFLLNAAYFFHCVYSSPLVFKTPILWIALAVEKAIGGAMQRRKCQLLRLDYYHSRVNHGINSEPWSLVESHSREIINYYERTNTLVVLTMVSTLIYGRNSSRQGDISGEALWMEWNILPTEILQYGICTCTSVAVKRLNCTYDILQSLLLLLNL